MCGVCVGVWVWVGCMGVWVQWECVGGGGGCVGAVGYVGVWVRWVCGVGGYVGVVGVVCVCVGGVSVVCVGGCVGVGGWVWGVSVGRCGRGFVWVVAWCVSVPSNRVFPKLIRLE